MANGIDNMTWINPQGGEGLMGTSSVTSRPPLWFLALALALALSIPNLQLSSHRRAQNTR